MVTKWGTVGGLGYNEGGWHWHTHITTYKLDKEDLLNSTGKSAQYCVITCMGKESEREWTYTYV